MNDTLRWLEEVGRASSAPECPCCCRDDGHDEECAYNTDDPVGFANHEHARMMSERIDKLLRLAQAGVKSRAVVEVVHQRFQGNATVDDRQLRCMAIDALSAFQEAADGK